jgi:hypothetical protein
MRFQTTVEPHSIRRPFGIDPVYMQVIIAIQTAIRNRRKHPVVDDSLSFRTPFHQISECHNCKVQVNGVIRKCRAPKEHRGIGT